MLPFRELVNVRNGDGQASSPYEYFNIRCNPSVTGAAVLQSSDPSRMRSDSLACGSASGADIYSGGINGFPDLICSSTRVDCKGIHATRGCRTWYIVSAALGRNRPRAFTSRQFGGNELLGRDGRHEDARNGVMAHDAP
jgi:hypothetical protein